MLKRTTIDWSELNQLRGQKRALMDTMNDIIADETRFANATVRRMARRAKQIRAAVELSDLSLDKPTTI